MTHVLFVGPGAIASLLCWHIQDFTRPFVLRHRPNLSLPRSVIDADRETPLQWEFPRPGVDFGQIDLVIVSCKATQVETAIAPLLPALEHASWLICCNGLGPQQWLSEQAPGKVLWASITTGALTEGQHQVRHTGRGEVYVGAPDPARLTDPTRELGHWLCRQDGPLTLQWEPAITERLWLKLAINAVINPITAVEGVANGTLAAPGWRSEIDRLCREIRAVAERCGHGLPADLSNQVIRVADRTAYNRSSMLRDVEAGRPTEIEFINGYLLRQALELGLNVPRLTHWYLAVRKLT